MNAYRFGLPLLCLLGLPACVSQNQPPDVVSAPMSMPLPDQRSYLDPGPNPGATGGPNYVRSNMTSGTQQTDGFGNDILRRAP